MAEQFSESEIESKVIEAIAEQLGVAKEEVTRDSEFDKICDSLDKAELMMEFEDIFEVSITDEAATKLIWLALRNITADWGRAAKEWREAMNQFAILYEERFTLPAQAGR